MAREPGLLATSGLLFLTSAGTTVHWWATMAGAMPMPGGWSASMVWMKMPGTTWLGTAASFLGMWIVMMMAMMLPSLAPALASYRRSLPEPRAAALGPVSALAGAGYFAVWATFGALAYPAGVTVVGAAMHWPALARSVPLATGIVLVVAGAFQLTRWKARRLACCRAWSVERAVLARDPWIAWRDGLRLGAHCTLCCLGLMTILLVVGVMNLGAMALVAGAITLERLTPWPAHAARATGVVALIVGAFVVGRALALG